ncbi:unnamed protein product, partial [Oppiella nova]
MGWDLIVRVSSDFVLAVNTDQQIFSFGRNKWGHLGRDVDRDGCHKPELGEGAYGQVYKVKHKDNYEEYAVKICKLNEKETQNVLNETQSLVKLRSEYVIQYYYSWIECNCLYFQMELCLDNLKNLLETKKPNNELMTGFNYYISYEIFRELTECVQFLHEKHIIHRDLKPDNLCDFGLAKEVVNIDSYNMSKATHTADVGDPGIYQAPEALGTVDYMAPEVLTKDYNHLIDIY